MQPLNRVTDSAQKHLQQFHSFCPIPKKKAWKKKRVWKPLDPSLIKTNFDGAMFEDINAVGIGIVVWNDRGEVLAALAERIPKPETVLVLKTLVERQEV